MDSFSLYRERIGESLTRRLADAIAQEIVGFDEAAEISQTILGRIDEVKNHEELMSFVEELAHKWPLFGPILVAEQAEKIEEKEESAISEVSNLLKENKIDEAAAAAENATLQSQGEAEPAIIRQDASPTNASPAETTQPQADNTPPVPPYGNTPNDALPPTAPTDFRAPDTQQQENHAPPDQEAEQAGPENTQPTTNGGNV